MEEATRGAVMRGLDKSRGARARALHVRRASSGGFIVRHEGGPEPKGGPDEEHVVPDMAALQQHIAGALGDGGEAGAIPANAGGEG